MIDCSFTMNAGVNTGGGMIHAILEGKIVSAPKEYGAFTGFEAAAKKLTCEKIRQQMKKVGMKLEIVPINTDYHERIFCLLV